MSGVKVTNERPARPIADVESVAPEIDDENYDWEPDATFGIPPGTDPGDVLTWDGDSWEPASGSRDCDLVTVAASGSARTVDVSAGCVYDITLDDDCDITLTGAVTGEVWGVRIYFRQPSSGGPFEPSFLDAVAWGDAGAPVWSTGAGEVDIVELETLDGGVTWFGTWGSGAVPDASGITFDPTGLTYTDATDVQEALEDHDAAIATVAASVAALGPGHAHVVEETHLSDGSTTTWTLDQMYEPGSVIAWNTTTIARLSVTEVLPDQATVSAAGSSGDKIVFDYAATLA